VGENTYRIKNKYLAKVMVDMLMFWGIYHDSSFQGL